VPEEREEQESERERERGGWEAQKRSLLGMNE